MVDVSDRRTNVDLESAFHLGFRRIIAYRDVAFTMTASRRFSRLDQINHLFLDSDRLAELLEVRISIFFGHDRVGHIHLIVSNKEYGNPVISVVGLVFKIDDFVVKFTCCKTIDSGFFEGLLFAIGPR